MELDKLTDVELTALEERTFKMWSAKHWLALERYDRQIAEITSAKEKELNRLRNESEVVIRQISAEWDRRYS